MQYESPISIGKKVIAKVKIFQKNVKLQGQGHEVKNYGTSERSRHKEYTCAI